MRFGPGTGGRKGNSNNSNHNNFGKPFSHKLNNPSSRAQYPPPNAFGATGNPDNLIRNIPTPEQAIGDFHSVPANSPPNRDIPSVLIAHIGNPDNSLSEPNWRQLLHYFTTDHALQGGGNLQDLYIFLTRIAILNTIITNRRLLLDFYLSYHNAPLNLRLRYDPWSGTDYIPPTQENPLYPPFPLISSSADPSLWTNAKRYKLHPMAANASEYAATASSCPSSDDTSADAVGSVFRRG